jgi:hypothetical protein
MQKNMLARKTDREIQTQGFHQLATNKARLEICVALQPGSSSQDKS